MKFRSNETSQTVYLLFLLAAIWLLQRALLGFALGFLVLLMGG